MRTQLTVANMNDAVVIVNADGRFWSGDGGWMAGYSNALVMKRFKSVSICYLMTADTKFEIVNA